MANSDLLDTELPVVETFYSLQGESTHAGRACHFIRLAGCNLRCTYCDTVYGQTLDTGTLQRVRQLVSALQSSPIRLVEITGGEPMIHAGTPNLCQALLEAGFEVLLETNGSLPLDKVPGKVHKIVDVKLPSSGMSEKNDPSNYALLQTGDELKFVTGCRKDFDFALAWIDRWQLEKLNIPLIFSPVFGKVALPELADWVQNAQRPAFRMQLQMHKFIWEPDRRGV